MLSCGAAERTRHGNSFRANFHGTRSVASLNRLFKWAPGRTRSTVVHTIVANADPPLNKQKATRFAVLLLCVYIFMLYSRVFEATILLGLPNIYLMFVLSGLALLTAIFKCGVLHAA